MPKIPRDVSGRKLAQLLAQYQYVMVRQTGSHIRLCSQCTGNEHQITIPDHRAIKIGTLNNILNDVAGYLKITKHELIEQLFKS